MSSALSTDRHSVTRTRRGPQRPPGHHTAASLRVTYRRSRYPPRLSICRFLYRNQRLNAVVPIMAGRCFVRTCCRLLTVTRRRILRSHATAALSRERQRSGSNLECLGTPGHRRGTATSRMWGGLRVVVSAAKIPVWRSTMWADTLSAYDVERLLGRTVRRAGSRTRSRRSRTRLVDLRESTASSRFCLA